MVHAMCLCKTRSLCICEHDSRVRVYTQRPKVRKREGVERRTARTGCVKRSPLSQVKRRLWKVSSVAAARSRWTTFTCACKLLDSGVYRSLREPRECHRIASSHVATDPTRQGTRNYLLRFLYITKQFCDSITSSSCFQLE